MKKVKWAFFFGLLIIFGILGAFIPSSFELENINNIDKADVAFMITATGLVLLMTPGLSFFYGGMVRRKNVISTMLQSFIAMGVISVIWVVFGFSLAFGDSIGGEGHGIIGNPFTYFMLDGVGGSTHPKLSPTIPLALFALFQLKFAIITPALITGSFAERVRFSSYLLFMSLFAVFIYAPLAHATWHPNGLLRNYGVLDFAGGTVVHMSAGIAALAGAIFLGRRRSQIKEKQHVPANITFVLLGTGMLWFGWFGFNAGSALEASPLAVKAFLNTNTASAGAMLAWILFDTVRGEKPSAVGASIGAIVGLVAITPAAGFVPVGASLFIGIFSSIVSNIAVHWKSKTSVDDALDVFPTHGIGGIVGMILTAVFAEKVGLVAGETHTFIVHIVALVAVMIFVFLGSFLIYKITDMIIPMRVPELDERMGLDISQHNEHYLIGKTEIKIQE